MKNMKLDHFFFPKKEQNSNIITDSQTFIKKIEKQRGYTLRDKQIIAIQEVEKGNNVLIVLPTSYGKTIPAIYACQRTKDQRKKAIWLSPLKALSQEHSEELERYFEVFILTGDYRDRKSKLMTTSADVIIMTYEMFNTVVMNPSKREEFMAKVGCLVVDEIHNICDTGRGAKLESTLKILNVTFPNIQKIMLSATIGNAQEFSEWLNAVLVYAGDPERPVPLEKKIVIYVHGLNPQMNVGRKIDKLLEVLHEYKSSNPQVLVFCSSRSRCEDLADLFNNRGALASFHHAGLESKRRKEIEQSFKDGRIQILFATTTLAQGINLPADICVLFDITRWNYLRSEEEFLSRNELIQTIGRAGRFGISQFGLAIAFCDYSQKRIIETMWNNPLVITSQIPKHLRMILLQWVTAGIETEEKLFAIFQDIFYDKEKLKKDTFDESLKWLLNYKFIERQDEKIVPTWIGRITTYLSIYPETTVHFLKVRNSIENLTDISYYELFTLIFNVNEFIDNIVVRNTKVDKEAIRTGESYLGRVDNRISKAFAMIFTQYLAEIGKEGATMVDGKWVRDIPRPLPMSSADTFVLQESASRIVNACDVILGESTKFSGKIHILNQFVSVGVLDEQIIELMQIEMIGIKRAFNLFKNGIKTIKSFIDTNDEKIQSIIGLREPTIKKLKIIAKDLVREKERDGV